MENLVKLLNDFLFKWLPELIVSYSVSPPCWPNNEHCKAGLTLNNFYNTTSMTHDRFSNFHCVYPIMQVVHTEFRKIDLTEYSCFKSSSKMTQKQAAATIIIALISEKNKS